MRLVDKISNTQRILYVQPERALPSKGIGRQRLVGSAPQSTISRLSSLSTSASTVVGLRFPMGVKIDPPIIEVVDDGHDGGIASVV